MKWRLARLGNLLVEPSFAAKLHAWLAVFWLLFAVPVLLLKGWAESVPLLVFISIYANVAGHYAAYQATRVERNQMDEGDS